MDGRQELGRSGERLAEQELSRRGLRIVERNARTRWGEIDLVCTDGDAFVFVEVKTRRAGSFVPAAEAVSARKLTRLSGLAQAWLAAKGQRAASWRVLIAAVTLNGPRAHVELLAPD